MHLDYLKRLSSQLDHLVVEGATLETAAEKVAAAVSQDGLVHLFGCGHSHILSEEVFYRAGGLANINPILIEPLMLHEGAVRSSQLERKHDFASTFLDQLDIRLGDVMIVVSTSGKNPVPIEVAMFAKEKGAFVIGLTSFDYSSYGTSNHSTGNHLKDVVDLAIDNQAVRGDAVMNNPGSPVPFGPTSTVIGAAILNAIFVEAINALIQRGITPPIFLSANMPGAEAHNRELVERYGQRIPLLLK